MHRHCVAGVAIVKLELVNAQRERDAYKNQVDQANKSARASIDQAHQIEANAFQSNASVHARVAALEAELRDERIRRTAAEAALELARRLPTPAPTPADKPIPPETEDASVIRSGLLELD